MDKSLSIDTGHHEKLYQERMNFLLTGEKDRVCSIYIDVILLRPFEHSLREGLRSHRL